MFTKDFWTAENELAYRATNNGIPSPVCGGFLANPGTDPDPTGDGFDPAPIGSDDEIILDASTIPDREIRVVRDNSLPTAADDDFELDFTPYFPAGI